MRYLALDIGTKRTGLAVSDATGLIARPYDVITGAGDVDQLVARLREVVETEEVEAVVLGLPRRLGGEEGPEATRVRAIAGQIAGAFPVPVSLWDERLSTVEATERLIEAGVRRKARKGMVDKVAAALILQSFLDAGSPDSARLAEAPA
ncbi:MAG: Holliday junction resolvase RuvX [Acidobacteria bacterium]|nr:Holliday junction resolvase RuvX [Acidobacteriota bacterium]